MKRYFKIIGMAQLITIMLFACSKKPTNSDDTEFHNYTFELVNTYPHDPLAYTQGLAFADGYLYEGTGKYGQSTLRRVDLSTGEILQQYDLPNDYFGEGITICDDRIIQLTWQSHIGFVYDKDSLTLIDEFQYPTEGWGITDDGTKLIMSDGSLTLYFLDAATYQNRGHIDVRDGDEAITELNELEYINGTIYANVWYSDQIVMISPKTGRVVGWIDLKGLISPEVQKSWSSILNGIAYDAEKERLFVTGKNCPYLYEIRLIEKN